MEESKLYIVATPIGNIEDITLRAIRILRDVDYIACEDTRDTARFLSNLEISKKLFSYHEFNKKEASERIIKLLKEGKSIALVSDAGTPCISDPGYSVVKRAREEGVKVIPIPGASAFTCALSVSGFATDSFVFHGFLTNSSAAKRKKRLNELILSGFTVVLYEAPHRILKLLDEINEINPDAAIFVGREITKRFEQFISGNPKELTNYFETKTPKGEFVVIINKYTEDIDIDLIDVNEEFNKLLIKDFQEKEAMKIIAKKTGRSKSEIYGFLKKKQ